MEKQIRFDWAMKRMLRDKANFGVLEGLMTSLLGHPIKIDRILESESNQENAENKSNRVDILAENSLGQKILIEVQNQSEDSYFHRMLFGTSRLISEYLKRGEPYEKVTKVYSVNIVYFDLGEGDDYVYVGKTEFHGLHKGDLLTLPARWRRRHGVDSISDIYPEYYILKANDFDRWSKTPIDQWMYFLSQGVVHEGSDAPGLDEVREKLRVDNLSKEERNDYYKYLDRMISMHDVVETAREDGLDAGRREGMEEGLKKGLKEGLRISAQKMIAAGIPADEVARILGVELNDILSID
jgi:hypothetical protein